MQSKVMLVLLLLAVPALAGCADGNPKKQGDGDEEEFKDFDLDATDDTGVIRGVVVDAAVVPVEGVTITLDSTGESVETNANGAFGFSRVEPGTQFLTASKPGFESIQQSVDVKAGLDRPPVVKIVLQASPDTRPFTQSIQFNGHIACSFTLVTVSFAACGVDPVASAVGNVFLQEHQYDRVAEFVQSEMVWDATQATGTSLSLSWTDPNGPGGSQVRIAAEAGESPVVVSFGREEFEQLNLTGKTLWLRIFSTQAEGSDLVDEETYNAPYRSTVYGAYNGTPVAGVVQGSTPACAVGVCVLDPLGEDCVKYPVLFDACLGLGGVGAAIDQSYEVFTTNFYNFEPVEGWLFIEDGAHPVPE